MRSLIAVIFNLWVTTSVTNSLVAKDIIISNKSPTQKYIGKQVLVYQDPTKKLPFDSIRKSNRIFNINTSDVINFGLTRNYNWLKFKIVNEASTQNIILNLEYPIIDDVKLYVVHQDNKIDSTELFENFSRTKRPFNSNFYLFPIKINQNEQIECYLRLFSYKPILAPISINSVENTVNNHQ